VLEGLVVKLDGTPAATTVVSRRRRIVSTALSKALSRSTCRPFDEAVGCMVVPREDASLSTSPPQVSASSPLRPWPKQQIWPP
jgi:hypothetical protein